MRYLAPGEIFENMLQLKRFGLYFERILKLFSCRNTYINYSCTHMLGGSGAYASSPEKKFKIWCSLVCFGVYFDQIFYIKNNYYIATCLL